jgi:tRNA modification GTPase
METIVALSTGSTAAAIAIIRLSGPEAFAIIDAIFISNTWANAATFTTHFGTIKAEVVIDEVVIGKYIGPNTYTGQDIVEISCHGSPYIIEQIIDLCITQGARLALPGEFTQRAFKNGKLNLSQAEAVADLIASENEAQHKIAWQQMRGGYNNELKQMREQLINFAALIELELDFSEEDVEFANRDALQLLIKELQGRLQKLASSFKYGNAIKKGVPVAIVGKPNAGKSTLLNALLHEEKAIVSNIPGTTRDVIEDVFVLQGISFRLIDTAGIRDTTDAIESLGIQRTYQKAQQADIVLLLVEARDSVHEIIEQGKQLSLFAHQQLIYLINKIDVTGACDAYDVEEALMTLTGNKALAISAQQPLHLDKLEQLLVAQVQSTTQDIIVSNQRHYQAIINTLGCLQEVDQAMAAGLSGDLMSIDIRRALQYLGSITGEVEVDRDILGTIFGKFCIGK